MSGLPWLLLIAAVAASAAQTWRLDACHADRRAMDAALRQAQSESRERATGADRSAQTTLTEKAVEDRPAVGIAAARVLRQCAPAARDLSLPAAAGRAGQAGGQAEDDRAFAQDLAADLETCQGELARLDAMRAWVKANGG